MRWLKKSIFLLIVILILLRLALPFVLLRYVEHCINQLPDYQATISDVSVELLSGNYTLHHLQLNKINKNMPVPYLTVDTINLAIEWKILLHGKFVAEITVDHPVMNLVVDPVGNNEQLTISAQWQKIVKSLFPLNFNRIIVNNGELYFRSFTAKPPFKLYLKNVFIFVDNVQSIITSRQAELPSTFNATAKTMDGAIVAVNGKFNPFMGQPTFYLTASLKNMAIKPTNNFLRHYIKLDVSSGQFSLYIELAAKNGQIHGYAKPFIQNLKITDNNTNNPIAGLYKGAAQLVAKILTNPKQNTIATRVNMSGNIKDPNTSIISIIVNLLSHAFIQALIPQIDHSVKMQDVKY